jgi:hypothetical protein
MLHVAQLFSHINIKDIQGATPITIIATPPIHELTQELVS